MLLGSLALCAKSARFLAGLMFVPFALGPLIVSLFFGIALSGRVGSQIAISIGSVLYAAWFATAYLDIFYWHLDAQSAGRNKGVRLLFVDFEIARVRR